MIGICWWKVVISIIFLVWGDRVKIVGRFNLYGLVVFEEKWKLGGSFDDRIDRLCCISVGKRYVWILRSYVGKGGVESFLRKVVRLGYGLGRIYMDI